MGNNIKDLTGPDKKGTEMACIQEKSRDIALKRCFYKANSSKPLHRPVMLYNEATEKSLLLMTI